MLHRVEEWFGRKLAGVLPAATVRSFVSELGERDPHMVLEAFGPILNRSPDLDNMPFDLGLARPLGFEHLAGLFSSTPFDHAIISMSVRQAAYTFGLVRRMNARRVIEIGRYKGGSTLLIAAAMQGQGEFWSIDIGVKESRLQVARRPFDRQLADACAAAGLHVTLLVGDSASIEVETGEVDLVFIDGDHSYDGVRTDFERFGRRVRVGGAVLFDDAREQRPFRTHSEEVSRLVDEVVATGRFREIATVNKLAHIERVAPDR